VDRPRCGQEGWALNCVSSVCCAHGAVLLTCPRTHACAEKEARAILGSTQSLGRHPAPVRPQVPAVLLCCCSAALLLLSTRRPHLSAWRRHEILPHLRPVLQQLNARAWAHVHDFFLCMSYTCIPWIHSPTTTHAHECMHPSTQGCLWPVLPGDRVADHAYLSEAPHSPATSRTGWPCLNRCLCVCARARTACGGRVCAKRRLHTNRNPDTHTHTHARAHTHTHTHTRRRG
jgi:hypothetical protein